MPNSITSPTLHFLPPTSADSDSEEFPLTLEESKISQDSLNKVHWLIHYLQQDIVHPSPDLINASLQGWGVVYNGRRMGRPLVRPGEDPAHQLPGTPEGPPTENHSNYEIWRFTRLCNLTVILS